MSLNKILAGSLVGFSLATGAVGSNLYDEVNLTPYVFRDNEKSSLSQDINSDGRKDELKVFLNCELTDKLVAYDLVVRFGNKNGFSKSKLLYRFGSTAPKNISIFKKEGKTYLSFDENNFSNNKYEKKTVKLNF